MNHAMVDIETTGLGPEHTGIIQIAAVRFNYDTEEIDFEKGIFDRCLIPPADRYWDENTRSWWRSGPKRAVLEEIQSRAEETSIVLNDFLEFLRPSAVLWAKPTHFEYPFLQSYSRMYGVPFIDLMHYRWANDLNSHIRGLFRVGNHNDLKGKFEEPEFVGSAHNALHDVFHQIKMLFEAKRQSRALAME